MINFDSSADVPINGDQEMESESPMKKYENKSQSKSEM